LRQAAPPPGAVGWNAIRKSLWPKDRALKTIQTDRPSLSTLTPLDIHDCPAARPVDASLGAKSFDVGHQKIDRGVFNREPPA